MANFIPGNIARKLKNPGERSKLSDSDLRKYAPNLYSTRIRNRQNATLYNPLAPLSGNDLRSSVNALTDAEINPQINALDRRLALLNANTAAQSTRLGGYYNQIGQGITAAQGAQATAAQNLATQLANSASAAQTAIGNAQTSYDNRAAQDAAIRGTGLDAGTSQQLAKTFVDQKTAAAQQAQTAESLANAQSQGFAGILNTAAAVLPARAADAQSQLAMQAANQANEIQQQKTDIQNTRGGIFSKNLLQLRQQEFENEAARQTLSLKDQSSKLDAAKLAANEADKAATRSIQQQRADETARHNAAMEAAKGDPTAASIETARHNRVMEKLARQKAAKGSNDGKGPDWRTPNEVGNAWKLAANALTQIKSGKFVDPKDPKKVVADLKTWDRHHIASFLASHGVDDALISAILDSVPKYNNGQAHLSSYTVQKLIDAGYKPSVIARKLGIKTAGEWKKAQGKRPTTFLDTLPNY